MLRRELIQILKHYRIMADGAYSEVQDKFHTQKEYEKALKNIEEDCSDQIITLVEKAVPLAKEFEVNPMGTCSLCGSMEADSGCVCEGWNKCRDQILNKLK